MQLKLQKIMRQARFLKKKKLEKPKSTYRILDLLFDNVERILSRSHPTTDRNLPRDLIVHDPVRGPDQQFYNISVVFEIPKFQIETNCKGLSI